MSAGSTLIGMIFVIVAGGLGLIGAFVLIAAWISITFSSWTNAGLSLSATAALAIMIPYEYLQYLLLGASVIAGIYVLATERPRRGGIK
ncbi:hypothetical protein [Spiribacter onubensis]|uniref:Uncharacterized protein n=1 Tax=Spiribacter onubensis TaxID=3122420 RepID=A0ABV3S6V8_9GAMM